MHRSSALLCLLLIAAQPAWAQRSRGESREEAAAELQHGTGKEAEFSAASLGGKSVAYWAYIPKPPKGETAKDLPLIIWLHGMREDHLRFHTRGGSAVLDRLIGEGVLPPCLLVCPNGGYASFWIDGKSSGQYESLVSKDLIAHLEKTYPIAKSKAKRALAGVSMGGLGALHIAMKAPENFVAVSAHSAAIFPPDPENLEPRFKRAYESWGSRMGLDQIFGRPIDAKIWKANNPMAIALSREPKAFAPLAIRFDAGTEDRYEFHESGQAFHKLLTEREIPHEWKLFEGAGHSWGSGSMPERLEAGFRFIAKAFQDKAKAAEPK